MTIAITPSGMRRPTLPRGAAPVASPPTVSPRATLEVVVDEDAQMIQAVKKGFLVGTPAVFAITAGMALVAGTTVGIAALIGGWSGVFGGWYFGTIFFINTKPRKRHSRS